MAWEIVYTASDGYEYPISAYHNGVSVRLLFQKQAEARTWYRRNQHTDGSEAPVTLGRPGSRKAEHRLRRVESVFP